MQLANAHGHGSASAASRAPTRARQKPEIMPFGKQKRRVRLPHKDEGRYGCTGPIKLALCSGAYQHWRQQRRREYQPWRQNVRQRTLDTGDAVLRGVRTVPPAGAAMVEEALRRPKPATAKPARMSERIESSLVFPRSIKLALRLSAYQHWRQQRRREYQRWRQNVRQRTFDTGDAVLRGVRTVPPAGAAIVEEALRRPKPATAKPARMSERIESSLVFARSSGAQLTKFGSVLQALTWKDMKKYWKRAAGLFIGRSHVVVGRAGDCAAPKESDVKVPAAQRGNARAVTCGWASIRCAAALACISSFVSTVAVAEPPARLQTNEAYVEDALRPGTLDMRSTIDVFAFVLSQLPERVRVYPTENYYYFRFTQGGVAYAGSLRLGPKERDAGKVEFGFYKDLTEWQDTMDGDRHAVLGTAEGVTVERVEGLRYRVTHGTKSVIFELNDLSGVKPPPQAVRPQETFIGPIFDESGIRFFLLYNAKLKVFHYVLDETAPVPDELSSLPGAERLLLGRRTGFAFYKDHFAERKILVGAYDGNSRLNNYFDGPFDQLPENFIEGETLRAAIIDADPEAKGQIDRLGNYEREEGRYMIHPYMLYKKPADLMRIQACAARESRRPDKYHACFSIEPEVTSAPVPPPKARKK